LATGTTRKGDILYFNKPVVMYADNSDWDSIDYRLLVDANGVSFNRKYIGNSSRQQSNDYFVIGQGMDNTWWSNNFWEFVEILYDDPYINYKVSNFPIYLYSNSFASSYLKKATYKNIMSVVGISISNTLQWNVGSIQIWWIYNWLNFSPKDIQINGIRYIKDTINWNNVDNVNYWSSIIAMDGAVDRAYWIIPTSEGELTNAEDVTDGDFTDYATWETGQEQTITLDLWDVYEIDTIIISHKNDGRIFNSATTEVSEDGINWYTLIQWPYTEETTGISKEIDYPILETVGNIIGKNMYISSYPWELSELPNWFVFWITLNESSLLIAPEKPEALVVNIDWKIEFLDMVDISEKWFLKWNSMSDSVYEYSKSWSGVLFNGTIQWWYSALPLSVTITGSSDYFWSESKIMDYTYKIIDNSNEQLLYSITWHFTMYVDWDWRTEQKTIIPNFYIEWKDIRIVIDYTIRAPNNENGSFSIWVQNVLWSWSVDYSKYIPSNNPIDLLFALEEKENWEIKAFRWWSVWVFDKLWYNIYNYIYSWITNSSERIQDWAFNENSNSMVIGKYAYPWVINLLNSNSNNNQFFVVMPSNFVAKSDWMLRIGTASTVSLNWKSIGNINNGCIPVRRGDRVSGVNASSNIFIPLF
jgi:hypothetical protein